MADPGAITSFAGAVRRHVARTHERRGRGNYEGEIKSLSPLRVDTGSGDLLTDDDVTIASSLASTLDSTPLRVGDTLVLVEPEAGDYTAIEVLRDDGADLDALVAPRSPAPDPERVPVFLNEAPPEYAGPCILAVPDDAGRCAMIYKP
jgi:hypothetical protein